MPQDFIAPISAFLDFLKEPSSLQELDDNKSFFLHPVVKNYASECNNNAEAIRRTLEQIAKNIQSIDTYKVTMSSRLFIDNLKNPHTFPFLSNFLTGIFFRNLVLIDRYIFKINNYVENIDIYSNSPDEIKAWKSIDTILESLSYLLSLNVAARMKLRENKNYFSLIIKLRTFIKPLEEIFNLYKLCDNEEFIVLNRRTMTGYKIIANGIQNNFQLFTILQSEMAKREGLPRGSVYNPNSEAVSYAKGERKFDIDRKFPELGLYLFYSHAAYKKSSSEKSAFSNDYLIPGRSTPMTIPGIDGIKLIFAEQQSKPEVLWDTESFKPINQHLISEVKITQQLDAGQVSLLLNKLTQ